MYSHSMFWSNAVDESGGVWTLIGNDSCQRILDALKAIYMLRSCTIHDGIYLNLPCQRNSYCWAALRTRNALVADVSLSVICPVVISRRLSKTDPQLLWNTINRSWHCWLCCHIQILYQMPLRRGNYSFLSWFQLLQRRRRWNSQGHAYSCSSQWSTCIMCISLAVPVSSLLICMRSECGNRPCLGKSMTVGQLFIAVRIFLFAGCSSSV